MSWLRWWIGTVNDPKWRIVASRAKCRAGDCIAVWAYLLEVAKEGDGNITNADSEECAVVLGYDVEIVMQIITAMRDKSLIDSSRIASWDKRQPKREDDSKARVAAYRARQSGEKNIVVHGVKSCNANVTQCNAPDTDTDTDTDISSLRSDIIPHRDSFEEEGKGQNQDSPKIENNGAVGASKALVASEVAKRPRKAANSLPIESLEPSPEQLLLNAGMTVQTLADWKQVRKAKRVGIITKVAAQIFLKECAKANITANEGGEICASRGWAGLKAEWLQNKTFNASNQYHPKKDTLSNALKRITMEGQGNDTNQRTISSSSIFSIPHGESGGLRAGSLRILDGD